MASVMMCPNCRTVVSPCLNVQCTTPQSVSPEPSEHPASVLCSRAHSPPCVPCRNTPQFRQFPLSYVCRHWLQGGCDTSSATIGTALASPCFHPCQRDQNCPKSPTHCVQQDSHSHELECSRIPTPCLYRGQVSPSKIPRGCDHTPCPQHFPSPPTPVLTLSTNPFSPSFSVVDSNFLNVPNVFPGMQCSESVSRRCSLDIFNSPCSCSSSRSTSPQAVILNEVIPYSNGLTCVPLPKQWSKEDDQKAIENSRKTLETSGWYYGAMSWQKASTLLEKSPEGTFLVRDSSSKSSPFALSVQTSHGPTSIRIEHERGEFWLDCEKKIIARSPGVLELILFYKNQVTRSENLNHPQSNNKSQNSTLSNSHQTDQAAIKNVWKDHTGKAFSIIKVKTPLLKKPQSLQHLCRIAINNSLTKISTEDCPVFVRQFLKEYPHPL